MHLGRHVPRLRERRPPSVRAAFAAGAAALLVIATPGCGTAQATEAEPPGPTGAWQLLSGTGPGGDIETPAGRRITLVLDDDQVTGVAACNSYGGAVAIDGERLRVANLSQTEMACDPPAMAAETAYMDALGRIETVSSHGDRLVLAGPSVELTFTPLPPVPTRELLDTVWELDSVIVAEVATAALEPAATLRLDGADATLQGGTGCRAFTGSYSIRGDEIVITQLAVDDAATAGVCAESAIEQERLVLGVLGDGFRTEVDADRLTLTSRDGRALVYRAK